MITRIRIRATALAALLAPLALPAQGSGRHVDRAIARYFDLVRPVYSGDSAKAVTAFVEQYFRVPGNTGFNASIERVRGVLERAGYQPESAATAGTRLTYRLEHRPMPQPTWEPVDASLSVVGDATPVLRFATNRNMLAINSYSTPAGGIEAVLIDVGKGTAAELDAASVAGKVVLAEAPLGQLFREAVQKRGALGALAYNMPSYTEPSRNRTSIQFGSIALDTAKKSWGVFLSYAAREALHAALVKGVTRVRVVTASRIYPSEELTLVAEVRGARLPDERYVFSAHVQEPGANDNATGVGAQAEMARVAAMLVKRAAIDPQRTITFLWGLEVSSTQRYLTENAERAAGVRWGTSLDMVGEDTKKTGGTFLIEKMPDPSSIWTRGEDRHTEWGGGEPLTKDKLRPHYFNDFILARCLDQASVTGWLVRTNPFEGGSDHVPFLRANKPGVLFWHFTDHFYHTDGDRLDKVSAPEMKNVGVSALVAALTLTSADGAVARAIIAEVQQAALDRIAAELALSTKAMASNGDAARERDILATWTDYYVKAFATTTDIEIGGTSAATQSAIDAAAKRVAQAGAAACAKLSGCAP
ncbi:MAG: M28 family metallopeptidase [Gemmatimonadota bacterium]|nr:M28 family metallopeptidase [Gemmatimonadota bacterium]